MQDKQTALDRAIHSQLCRRAFLERSALGVGGFALSSLFGFDKLFAASPHAFDPAKAKAKRMIVIFLSGGLSQLDLFDEKPLLNERRGEELPPSIRKEQRITGVTERQGALPVVGSKFKFSKYGKSGMTFSECLPHMAQHADKFTLVKSLQTDHVLHEAAMTSLFTGTPLLGRPSWGAWVSYALGSLNKDLPEFVVLLSGGERLAPLHPRVWHSGFLPGKHQGVPFRSGGEPVLFVKSPPGVTKESDANVVDAISKLNEIEQQRTGDDSIQARINAYEMAGRMQSSVPELADISKESPEVLKKYGAQPGQTSFANNCLLARRLCERGVRFIQVADGGWDHHGNIPRALPNKCEQVDKPASALLSDLEESGMLEDTIVMFTGEFGRTSYCEGSLSYRTYGRDHNARVNSVLLAGGGFKRGFTYGATDDWGWDVVENPVHVHDLQATVLHNMGLDHEKLTYRHMGRDFRLTDVAGNVVHDLLI